MASNGYGITKEEIEDLYVKQGLSMQETAEKLYCSLSTVRTYMRLHGIAVRDPQTRNHRMPGRKPVFTKKELEDMYVKKGMSCYQIAQEKGTHPSAVNKALKRLGIQSRSRKEGLALWNEKVIARKNKKEA